ncbi:hypothetical protein C1701_15970 [Actinoalloteichus sp. AHMU CJ021]|uniref:Multiple sugar transport system substrate-binding protein n=1 Tax=Actinoalloteichus caeruleus DSM 43889 TaxID=1120930 RepID=A0ABT1JMW5_ACTCY|nr:hypothetical protein C1701_15970 [Actinoalloteichus sp. AHMU CJ021]MCP2333875.1 multiple sugar transport system substrate-binding protein [Actinoalloteichus caeruleus DSM 43889]
MGVQGSSPWRRGLTVLSALTVLGAVGACGGTNDGGDGDVTIRFTWWGSDDRARLTEEAVALFEERNPGIDVVTSYSAFDGYFEKLATETAGGNPPDVIQMDYAYLREYADRGVLADLNEFGEDQLGTEEITPLLATSGEIDGALYALPMGQNTHTFAYDVERWTETGVDLPEPGWTWEDWFDASLELADATDGESVGLTDFGWSWETFQVWLRQQDKDLYTEDAELAFERADVVEYMELLDRFRSEGASTEGSVTAQIDGAVENSPVSRGLAFADFSWDSTVPSFFSVLGRPVALAPMPRIGERVGQFAKPAMLVSVAEGSEHKEAAAALVDFLLNDEDAGKIQGTTRGMPVNESVREAVGAELEGADEVVYEYEELLADELEETPPPPPPGNSTLKREWERLNQVVAFGQISIDEAADQFLNRAQQEL